MKTSLGSVAVRTDASQTDGRRARSETSRAKIVAAMLDLVGKGDIAPSAARVAETAGVGLRSVFRHFDDMDALYREMSQAIEAQVLPMALKPLTGATWRERLLEIIERRVLVFETILPFRISANIKRFQSEFLMQDYRRMLRLERTSLEAILPAHVRADIPLVDALNVPLSFQTWRLLRHDQELSIADARAVVVRLVEAVLAQIPD
jgi:AcrR family transcriptional regulator